VFVLIVVIRPTCANRPNITETDLLGNLDVLDFFTQNEQNCSFSSSKERKNTRNVNLGKITKITGFYLKFIKIVVLLEMF